MEVGKSDSAVLSAAWFPIYITTTYSWVLTNYRLFSGEKIVFLFYFYRTESKNTLEAATFKIENLPGVWTVCSANANTVKPAQSEELIVSKVHFNLK